MKKSKRLLSVFLAVVMLLSSLTVGFYAIAADDGSSADSAVADAQASIDAFYENRIYLFSESNKEKHEQAVKDYDASTAKVKALTEEQKLELDKAYYGFILYYVTQSVARDLNGGSASTPQYVDATMNHVAEIEEVIGEIPASYMEVYDVFKAFYGNYTISSSTNWKDNDDAIAAFETWAKALVAMDEDQFEFANYLSPSTGGFYFYNFSLKASDTVFPNIVSYEFNIVQDNETESGTNPSSVSKSKYIKYNYSSKTGTWVEGQNGATYLAAFEDYYELVKSDRVAVAEKALDFILDLFESSYPGLTDAVNNVVDAGAALINDRDSVKLDEVKAVIDEYNNMDPEISAMASKILENSNLVMAASIDCPIELNEDTDATEAYNNSPEVKTYTGENLVEELNAYVNAALLEDFIEYVNGVDTDALTDEIIAETQNLYSQLSGDNKGAIPEDTYNKFITIISPKKNVTDYADEIATFRPTDFVRPPESSVAWTEGGIQSFVDKLGGLVGSFVNLNDILSDNLYQDTVLEAIMDLYATLAHNETKIDVGIGGMTFTLGEIIGWVVTPESLAKQLEEDKFDGAVAKIEAIEVTEEDKAAGLDKYDKLAAIDFTAEDFGFTAGDRDGFIDALLAVLRPITVLLDPDASIKAMGLISVNVGIKMFDYTVSDDGVYSPGAYEKLLPLFEQLGLNDLPTAAEYKTNYYNVKEASGANIAADEFLRPIIESLFTNVVDPVCDDPLDGVIDILPRLAYVVDGDRLNTWVKDALSQFGLLSALAGSLDLSTDAINNLIPDTIDVGALVGDGTDLVLNIGDLPWSTLADCATLSAVKSSTIYNEYTLLRTGETDSCMSTIFYWLYDVALADDDTYAALKTLIKSVVPSDLASLVDSVISMVLDPAQAAGKINGYGLVLDNALIGGTPTGNEIWRIDATAGNGGSISPSGTVALKQADSRTFSIAAAEGYTISSLTVNGKAVADAAGKTAYDYTVKGAEVTSSDNVNYYPADVTIQVTFADESGEPVDPDEPDNPDTPDNPDKPGDQGNTDNNNGNSGNTNGKLPINNNNPNLPNTGAQEIAGMSFITIILAAAAGIIVWLVFRKRIAE